MTCFPDVNVWIALTIAEHKHHEAARGWYDTAPWDSLVFSRVTQMAFLRLLTNEHVMGKRVATASGAWEIMDSLLQYPEIRFVPEMDGIDTVWREFSKSRESSPNLWTDAWLAAFALTTGFRLVTFDRGFFRFAGVPLEILSTTP
jgi:toxin-antitoxin system PIN domain toxin